MPASRSCSPRTSVRTGGTTGSTATGPALRGRDEGPDRCYNVLTAFATCGSPFWKAGGSPLFCWKSGRVEDMSALQADIEARLREREPDVEVLLAEVMGGKVVRLFIDHPQG